VIAIDSARWAAQRVPRRLAETRLHVLDLLLDDLERMRLEGDRTLPPDVSAMLADLAQAHDPTLPGLSEGAPHDVTTAQDRLLAAQAQVMRELARLRGDPEPPPTS
jgi:hypothetical protein